MFNGIAECLYQRKKKVCAWWIPIGCVMNSFESSKRRKGRGRGGTTFNERAPFSLTTSLFVLSPAVSPLISFRWSPITSFNCNVQILWSLISRSIPRKIQTILWLFAILTLNSWYWCWRTFLCSLLIPCIFKFRTLFFFSFLICWQILYEIFSVLSFKHTFHSKITTRKMYLNHLQSLRLYNYYRSINCVEIRLNCIAVIFMHGSVCSIIFFNFKFPYFVTMQIKLNVVFIMVLKIRHSVAQIHLPSSIICNHFIPHTTSM